MGDHRPSLAAALSAFGVAGTVRRPDDDAAAPTTVMWLAPEFDEQPYGTDFVRREPRKVIALPRADVETMPRGTVVTAPEFEGEPSKRWQVQGLIPVVDPDHWRVSVKEVECD